MEDDKLEFGIGLDVDIPYFKKAWDNKQDEIQKIIDGTKFKIKIDGVKQARKELDALVNTDSITGLKNELRGLEMQWANLSREQKFADESMKTLTPDAAALAMRYRELTEQVKQYGMTLKEADKTGRSISANRVRIAAEDLSKPNFTLMQMAEYYKVLNEEMTRQAQITDSANKLLREEEAVRGGLGKTLADAIILQNQMEQARNADYEALVRQLKAEEELAEQMNFTNLRREAYQGLGQESFDSAKMRAYYEDLEKVTAEKRRQQEVDSQYGKTLAEAIVLQNQMEQARNADYAALVRQLKAEEELSEQLHLTNLRREAYQSLGQQDFSSAVSSEYFRMLEEESRLLKEKSDSEAQRGAARFRESQRIQQEKQRELQLQREEYAQLVKQYQLEAELANKELQRRNNEKNTSRQRQISEGLRIQQILATQAKTIDQINARLSIQKQRLGQATIGSEKYKKIALDIALLEQRLKSLNASQQRNIDTVNLQTDAYKHQAGILNGMKQFINSYISLLGAVRLMKNIKDITAEFELQRVSLRAITQDVAFADQLFANLKTTAQQSPFSTKDLVTYTKQLAAYRVENEDLYDTMQMLADISAGLGVGMDRLILAFGQVRAASVLRGTELRQFTEAGIPLVDELADRFSRLRGEIVSTGEVFDLISQREVPFAMVSEIFRDMTEEGGRFYDMQKKQSESLYGVWENLKDAVQNAYDEIGRSNSGLLMGVGKTLTSLANNLDNIGAILTPVIAAFGAYRLGVMLSSSSQRGLTRSTKLLQKAEKSLNRDLSRRTKLQGTIYKLTMQARVANNKYALSLIKASTATNALSASLHKLRAAMLKNPITAILTVLVSVLTTAITWIRRYNDKLYSSESAQAKVKEATDAATESMRQQQSEYDKLVKKVAQYDTLIKNQGKDLNELKKIYPELYSAYQSDEEANQAATNAMEERKKLIEEIKALSPKYLSDIDAETASIDELGSAWRKAMRDMRDSAIQELLGKLGALETQLAELESAPEKFLGLEKVQKTIKHTKEQIDGLTSAINSLKKANQDEDEYLLLWRQRYNELLGGGTMSVDALNEMSFVESIDKTKQAWKQAKEDVVLYRNAINALDKDESINAEDREKQIKRYQAEMAKAAATVRGAESYAKFAGFELEDVKKTGKAQIQLYRTEFQMIQKIYKEYQDLRKLKGDTAAAEDIRNAYGSVIDIDFLSEESYKERLKRLAKEVNKTTVKIKESSGDASRSAIDDTKKWTRAYEEQLKIWEQSGKFAEKAYRVKDSKGKPTGNWTVGWGFEYIFGDSDELTAENLKKVTEDTTMTLDEANAELAKQLLYRSRLLDSVLQKYEGLELTAEQYSALLDIVYNTAGQEKNVEKILDQVDGDLSKLPDILRKSFTTAAATGEVMPGLLDRAKGRAEMFAGEFTGTFEKISAENIEQLPSYLTMQILKAIGDVDVDSITRELESELNKISNQISRQKEASEFFGKMIGLTGNTELATNLTLAITGVDVAQQQDVKGLLTQQISEILSLDVVAPHVEFDINKGIDVLAIQGLIDKIDDKAIKSKLQSALDGYINYQKDAAIKIQETIAEFANADTRIKSLEAQMKIELDKEPGDTDYQDAVRRKYGQEIGAVKFDAFQEQYAKELDNIDALTVTAIDKIYSELNTLLASGIFEASDLKSILDLLERLSNVRVEKTSWESFRKAWKAYKDATSNEDKSKAWSDMSSAAKVLESDLKDAEGAINDILDSISDVADAMGLSFGDETENVINAFKDGMGAVTSTMVGFNAVLKICDVTGKSLMSTLWPLLAIGAALGAINYFSNMDINKANKEIEEQQKAIEDLQRSYENLQQAQEDLFADDWWRNQNSQISNLRRQADAIQKQLRAERSKGKDADEDAIQEYKDSYEEALDDIAEKQKEVFEHFSGTTKYSVIQDFANSAMDAYWTFSNAADGMRDKFRDMLQSMVAESVLAKVISRRLEPVFNAIDDAFGDGQLSNSELANISDKMQMIITTLPEELNAILDSLGLDAWRDASESGLTGIAKGTSQASEESILTLAGVGNSLLYNQIVIRDDVSAIRALLEGKVAAVAPSATTEGGMNVGQMVALQQQSVAHLQAIQNNTAQTVSEVRALNEKIDSVISPIGTRSRKTINTSLR